MTTHDRAANIVCFLSLFLGECTEAVRELMNIHPVYLVEKFDRYVEAGIAAHEWGMHPNLRDAVFNVYVDNWKLDIEREEEDRVKELKELILFGYMKK